MIYRGPAFGSSPTLSPLPSASCLSCSVIPRVKAWSSIKLPMLSGFLSEIDSFFQFGCQKTFFSRRILLCQKFLKKLNEDGNNGANLSNGNFESFLSIHKNKSHRGLKILYNSATIQKSKYLCHKLMKMEKQMQCTR
jgi:hypothetical protein